MNSVIVYHNPLERMFWESGMPFYIAMLILCFLVGAMLSDIYSNWKRRNKK